MVYSINRNQARWRIVDGEAVLINVESSYYYSLNKTGTLIWELLLEQNRSLDDLVQAVSERYGKPGGAVEGDVRSFFDLMTAEGLVIENN